MRLWFKFSTRSKQKWAFYCYDPPEWRLFFVYVLTAFSTIVKKLGQLKSFFAVDEITSSHHHDIRHSCSSPATLSESQTTACHLDRSTATSSKLFSKFSSRRQCVFGVVSRPVLGLLRLLTSMLFWYILVIFSRRFLIEGHCLFRYPLVWHSKHVSAPFES